MNCRICHNSENNIQHLFREMMYGTRDEFEYVECSKCGTIQIGYLPPNIADYYPRNYGGFSGVGAAGYSTKLSSKLIARAAGRYFTGSGGLTGFLATKIRKWPDELFPYYLREEFLDLNLNSNILDFGCGSGDLLLKLNYLGFKNLLGIDAFVDDEIAYENGLRVLKTELSNVDGKFDLIMLHHSFEHLPDPREFLATIHRKLLRRRHCIIRVPVVAKAWRIYGRNWAQLDAPRHFHLFTENGFRQLAEASGFEVVKVIYDSFAHFQFWASELYSRDIPLISENERDEKLRKELFDSDQLQAWELEAAELNRRNDGDQACYFLKAVDSDYLQ